MLRIVRLRWLGLVGGMLLALVACAQQPAGADSLLLTPDDFPDRELEQSRQFAERETPTGAPSAQTILEGDNTQLYHSVVVFPSDAAAQQAVEAVELGGAGGLWEPVADGPAFGDASVVFTGRQGNEPAALAVFRQGSILQRVTLVGSAEVADLEPFVRQAEAKARDAP